MITTVVSSNSSYSKYKKSHESDILNDQNVQYNQKVIY